MAKTEMAKTEMAKTESTPPKAEATQKDLDGEILSLMGDCSDIVNAQTPKLKAIKKTPEYKKAMADRLRLIKGQLGGHSIKGDVRENLQYELQIIASGQWEPGVSYRRPYNKNKYKEGFSPAIGMKID
jgi:hypothetical protein